MNDENLPDIETVSTSVHAAWMQAKLAQNVTSRLSESGEELMRPYAELSDTAKELDRSTVKAVYAAILTSPAPAAREVVAKNDTLLALTISRLVFVSAQLRQWSAEAEAASGGWSANLCKPMCDYADNLDAYVDAIHKKLWPDLHASPAAPTPRPSEQERA